MSFCIILFDVFENSSTDFFLFRRYLHRNRATSAATTDGTHESGKTHLKADKHVSQFMRRQSSEQTVLQKNNAPQTKKPRNTILRFFDYESNI